VTPALEQLHADAISLQAGALADSTKRHYGYLEVYWVRFLLVFQLLSFMLNPSEFVVLLYVAFLARSVQYAAVKHYLQGLQRFLRSQAGRASSHICGACSRPSLVCGGVHGRWCASYPSLPTL
jgi:hypothetical protein